MLTGYISYWNAQRGFGFIQGDDGERIFVHISVVTDANNFAGNVNATQLPMRRATDAKAERAR